MSIISNLSINQLNNNSSNNNKFLKKDPVIWLILANLIMIFLFILRINKMPPQIPLFYHRIWGEDQLTDTWLIFIIPFFMNFFIFINNYFVKKFFKENAFIKKLIFFINFFILISSTLAFVKIIFLVT